MKYLRYILAITAISFGMSGTANSALIKGDILWSGEVDIDLDAGLLISELRWHNPLTVVSATEDLSVLAVEELNANTLNVGSLPVAPLWTAGTFSFTLNSISFNDGTYLEGYGIMSSAGFDDTEGKWIFSGQNGGASGPSSGAKFGFSASNVPEPSILALMGLGLVALGFSRRKLKK